MTETPTFVHVIESPGSLDLLDGRTEGRTLCAFLDLAEIPNTYCLATDSNTFDLAMTDRLLESVKKHSAFPILHLSAHGNADEIALTNGDLIEWKRLSTFLQPINNAIGDNLLVCLSSCHGLSARKMVLHADTLPTSMLVACEGAVEWHQAVIAYVTFYNHLFKIGSAIDTAVAAMNTACGRVDFKTVNIQNAFKLIQQLKSLTPQKMADLIARMKQISDNKAMHPSRGSTDS